MAVPGFLTATYRYNWMGGSPQASLYVNQTSFAYTSTRSIFTMSVGGLVEMNITFMSPIT